MSELAEIQRAFARMCFDRSPAEADLARLHGDEARWLIYRGMVRSRLFAMMRSGLPRTAELLGDARFDDAVSAYLEAHTPRTRFIREVVHELVTHALPGWEADETLPPHVRDLVRWEDAKWRVGALEEPAVAAVELDFERPAVINPVLETLEVTHRVDRDHLAPETLDEPHLVLVYRKPGATRIFTYVLNDVGARLFRAWSGPRSQADGVRAVLAELGRDKPTQRFLEGMASVLADLVEQKVVLGSPPS
ncbi:MAG: DNA-binding domain-containing protein [Sandaracinaceae bacterium]|nr:hypothetical protein [Myxococcales bacterium]